MEYDTHLIGQRIKEARKAKRYTQDYVSAQANIGEKFLSQIECGNAGLSVQTLLSLCNILEVMRRNAMKSAFTSKALENSIGDILQGLTPRQLQDVETILKIFVKNCK